MRVSSFRTAGRYIYRSMVQVTCFGQSNQAHHGSNFVLFGIGLDNAVRTPKSQLVGWVLLYVHINRRLIRDGSPGRPPPFSHSSLCPWPLATAHFIVAAKLLVSVLIVLLVGKRKKQHNRIWYVKVSVSESECECVHEQQCEWMTEK